jgi:ribonuclease I
MNDDFDAMSSVIPSAGLDERQLVEFGTCSASDGDPQIV